MTYPNYIGNEGEALAGDASTNLFVDPTSIAGYPRAIRSQADNLGDYYSELGGINTGNETLTRQEMRDEADINYLIDKFNGVQNLRPLTYGSTIDYTMDLQQAIDVLNQVNGQHFDVPEELKRKYPTWREVLNGAESGEYQWDLANLAEIKKNAEEKTKRDAEASKATPEPSPKA